MAVTVKICGITNQADALAAMEAGADALGFVFYNRSPRFVQAQQAAEITRILPPHIIKVGVFVDAEDDLVIRAVRECGLNLLQFHGNEPPESCGRFGVMSMKAIRVSGPESLELCARYHTEALLLDAWSPSQLGGTGETFNWELAVQARNFGKPVFLAGGLTPENVGEAVRRVRPFGVDVSSGVESSPGKKDHGKVRAFIQAAKSAAAE